MREALLKRIEDLADRVLAGEVVFFVGAGFSRDTENNTAERLVVRLLARFYALHRVLTSKIPWLVSDRKARSNAQALHNGLMTTFNLEKHFKDCMLDPEQFEPDDWSKISEGDRWKIISTLAREYYVLNDWMCNAYDEMLEHMLGQAITGQAKQKSLNDLARADQHFLDLLKSPDESSTLEPVKLNRLAHLPSPARGKALFLDTMGFGQSMVMGGDPDNRDINVVIGSYQSLLLPRHHLLARLAREGLCPTLITTNFDLLLEGAYRLAGLQPRRGPAGEEALERDTAAANDPDADEQAESPCFPPTRWPTYERITRAHQYYYRPLRRRLEDVKPNGASDDTPLFLSGGQQAATIVKIHGCAETYRHACYGPSEESGTLAEVLSSLVFTFREIQNWRQDSWSRDLLLTLLRTRTMVFCGYSTADPVLHDTFRTVYEEMARRFRGRPFGEMSERRQGDAPAFFLAGAYSREFHALEVLRAASQAIGVDRVSLTEHPNYLEFFYRNDKTGRFPHLDELLSWLFHRVYRLRQRQALESELRSIATLLMPDGVVESGAVKRVIDRFNNLCDKERLSVCGISPTDSDNPDIISLSAERARMAMERVNGWTLHFHPRLLREFALAGLRLRKEDVGAEKIKALRETPWYFAAGENFGWTAWGVVVELALRRIAARLIAGKKKKGWSDDWCDTQHWHPPGPWIETSPGSVPTVDFSLHRDMFSPVRLTIRHRELDEPVSATLENDGLPRSRITWNLTLDRLPWSIEKGDIMTPPAKSLWAWASDSDLDDVPSTVKEREKESWYREFAKAANPDDLPDPQREAPKMTASDITNHAVNRLQSVLQSKHAVLPVDTLDKLCEAEDCVSLAGARAVIGRQFDHRAELMILDPRLGTFGLVHELKPQTTTADIRRLIEHAAFTRHLVLSRRLDEGDGLSHRRLPLTVELVLMMPPGEPSLHTRVGNALIAIRRTTTHLHGFGISLLHFGEEPRPAREEEAELRRAFCWLLTNTRKWFTQQASVHLADQQPRRWIQSLTLTGWRVSGIRKLKFDLPSDPINQKHADIHIVHGGNGAGKSSIVEAIEFALLGSVERLRVPLASAVEHRPMSAHAAPSGAENGRQPASVTLTMVVEGSPDPQTHTANSRGEPPPAFLPKLRAGSFRLDQSAMDRLAGSDDRERAAYFLSRFFPSDHEAITALDDARSSAETAWRNLPEDLAIQLSGREDGPAGLPPVGGLLDSLAWLAGPVFECKTETEGAGLCLPVALDDLQVLARIEPSLAEPVKRLAAGGFSEDALEEALRALDRPLHHLAASNQLPSSAADQIDIARKALSRKAFDEWAPVPRTDVDDPLEALNRWLHALAFADLARRQRELLEALTDARKNGWHPNESGKPIGLTAVFGRQSTKPSLLIEQLLKQEEDWKQQVIKHEQKLPTASSAVTFGTGLDMAVPALTETEREALDAVTGWLLRSGVTAAAISDTPSPELPLGQTVAEALRMGERRRCGALTIGEPGWADVIRKELDTLATSLSRLNKRSDGRQRGRGVPEQRLDLLRSLHAAVRNLSEAQRKAEQSFLNKVLPELEGPDAEPPLLSCALDELLTLFTPARWGYATLGLRRQTGTNGQQSLSFSHAGEGDAQLRLNTAELNLLTVALFLLCAPGTGNPVRLLVFDDPLQNMDEQTVTVLARGIGKLATLLPGGWQLVFFFHGEDDLARFRNELPARIYSLPWLMPMGTGTGEHPDVEGDYPPAPCATTHTRQSPKFVLRRPR